MYRRLFPVATDVNPKSGPGDAYREKFARCGGTVDLVHRVDKAELARTERPLVQNSLQCRNAKGSRRSVTSFPDGNTLNFYSINTKSQKQRKQMKHWTHGDVN